MPDPEESLGKRTGLELVPWTSQRHRYTRVGLLRKVGPPGLSPGCGQQDKILAHITCGQTRASFHFGSKDVGQWPGARLTPG